MLDVYIWGPAFGLPSIDPECLAILLYLDNALPSDAWRIIPCNDSSVSPSNLLPALNHNGSWTSGYLPIVQYAKLRLQGRIDEKQEHLSPSQQADDVAYCAFLTANAAPLVYLSLYVSAANWSTTTRPAYSALLPFPLTWTLPPLIRAEAITRAEDLGLAELDTDFDPNGGLHLTAGRDALPETFRKHLPERTKKTIREEMTPEQASAIRLFSLAEDCLSVLNSLMVVHEGDGEGAKPCFFGGDKRPSSADCLAYAYLALMVVPPVPRSFLKDYICAETPRLAVVGDWARGLRFQFAPAPRPSLLESTARVTDTIIRNVPSIDEHYADEMRRRKEAGITGLDRRALIVAMGLLATGAAVGYGLQLYQTLGPFGSRTQIWRQKPQHQLRGNKLSQFGDLGSMLDSALGAYDPPPLASTGQSRSATGHLVEVDSEVD
ncbi:hypothetical protein E4U42_006031 [Claviceps africana]|uniref:Mitochondrial outer membrane transport complex Sam37/metaxin N-terminal domain-containing protein n=1 Tax=Claviceps africana TaxID=83212 RepID=A0A8K0J4Z6_9HYPO|nr:hypothetical protein E4U42_006031 [Claviceps africana]